jgi:hypothetical protein
LRGDAQHAVSTSLPRIALKVMKQFLKKPQLRRKVDMIGSVNACINDAKHGPRKR